MKTVVLKTAEESLVDHMCGLGTQTVAEAIEYLNLPDCSSATRQKIYDEVIQFKAVKLTLPEQLKKISESLEQDKVTIALTGFS
jgi:hypothetical protein